MEISATVRFRNHTHAHRRHHYEQQTISCYSNSSTICSSASTQCYTKLQLYEGCQWKLCKKVCICSMPGRLPQDHIIKSPAYLPLLCGADKLADTKDKRRMISSFMLDWSIQSVTASFSGLINHMTEDDSCTVCGVGWVGLMNKLHHCQVT